MRILGPGQSHMWSPSGPAKYTRHLIVIIIYDLLTETIVCSLFIENQEEKQNHSSKIKQDSAAGQTYILCIKSRDLRTILYFLFALF